MRFRANVRVGLGSRCATGGLINKVGADKSRVRGMLTIQSNIRLGLSDVPTTAYVL